MCQNQEALGANAFNGVVAELCVGTGIFANCLSVFPGTTIYILQTLNSFTDDVV